YHWGSIVVTASYRSAGNTDVALNLDVHDASQGVQDDWIFYGDSITQEGMDHAPHGVGTFGQLINAQVPGTFPVDENGGIGYLTSADGAAHVGSWLSAFPGRYVGLAY